MRKRLLVLVSMSILLLVLTSVVRAETVEVLAHYCAWYKIPWYLYPYTMPLKGFYNSWDPIVAAEQNEEKNEYGIDVDVISWAGPNHFQETWMLAGYFNAYNFSTRKFCMLYEIIPLLGEKDCYDFNDPVLAEKFLYHIDYLVGTFSHYPNYYKIDNRMVVYIWTGSFKNFEQVSKQAREKVYLIGPEPILFPPNDNDKERIERLKCWDAIMCYGIHPVYLTEKYGALTTEAIKEYVRAVIKWDRILKLYAPQTELILSIQFGFQNIYKLDGQRFCSSEEELDMFTKTVRFLADILGIKRVFLVSYNENYEGTGAEPSVQYGYLWLSLIKKYFKDN